MKTGRKAGVLWHRQSLVGMRFTRLVVESAAPDRVWSNGNVAARWNCICDCGKIKVVQGTHLKSGATRSCGCLLAEVSKKRMTTHGHGSSGHKTPTYSTWKAMKTRCTNPNQPFAENYIGRGITVCDRWINSFENFLADMGERPKGHTIERKDNNLGYFKENCRWATGKEQQNNKRNNRTIEHNGMKLTVSQWAVRNGIPAQVIFGRLHRGMDESRAITQPVRYAPKRKTVP